MPGSTRPSRGLAASLLTRVAFALLPVLAGCDGLLLDEPPSGSDPSVRSDEEVCGRWRADVATVTPEWTRGPTDAACDAGRVAPEAIDNALRRLNLYRWLAGLPPATHDEGLVEQQQACALVQASMGRLDHEPPRDAACWSELGARGAGSSNLAYGVGLADSIDLYIDDPGVDSLGHRRWVLNPELDSTGFGLVDTFSCMYAFSQGGDVAPPFVAWPPPGPVPAEAADGRFSFHSRNHTADDSLRVTLRFDGGPVREVPHTRLPPGFGSATLVLAFDAPPGEPVGEPGHEVEIKLAGLSPADVSYRTRWVACP